MKLQELSDRIDKLLEKIPTNIAVCSTASRRAKICKQLLKIYSSHTLDGELEIWLICSIYVFQFQEVKNNQNVVQISLFQLFKILCKNKQNQANNKQNLSSKEPLKDFLVSCKKWLEFTKSGPFEQKNVYRTHILKVLSEIDAGYTTAKILAVKFDQIFDSVFPECFPGCFPERLKTVKIDIFRELIYSVIWDLQSFVTRTDFDLVDAYSSLVCCFDHILGKLIAGDEWLVGLIRSTNRGSSGTGGNSDNGENTEIFEKNEIVDNFLKQMCCRIPEKLKNGTENEPCFLEWITESIHQPETQKDLTKLKTYKKYRFSASITNYSTQSYVEFLSYHCSASFDARALVLKSAVNGENQQTSSSQNYQNTEFQNKNREKHQLPSNFQKSNQFQNNLQEKTTPFAIISSPSKNLSTKQNTLNNLNERAAFIIRACGETDHGWWDYTISKKLKEIINVLSSEIGSAGEIGRLGEIGRSGKISVNNFDVEELASQYYRILSDMVTREVSAKIPASVKQFESLLEKSEFHKCLIGVAFEWMQSVDKEADEEVEFLEYQEFPWILGKLEISAFKFYKIVEPILRGTTVTKENSAQANHLRSIEEHCLVNLCWKHDSKLWDTLISTKFKNSNINPENNQNPYQLPSIQHVLPKSELTKNTTNFFTPDQDNSVMQSPATASMRFDSLRNMRSSSLKSTARRQLFLRNKTEVMEKEFKMTEEGDAEI